MEREPDGPYKNFFGGHSSKTGSVWIRRRFSPTIFSLGASKYLLVLIVAFGFGLYQDPTAARVCQAGRSECMFIHFR
jgi:hypothetical protein